MHQHSFLAACAQASTRLGVLSAGHVRGEIAALSGLAVEVRGLAPLLSVGDRLALHPREGAAIAAEVVGFRSGLAQALAFGPLDGLGPGRTVLARLPPRAASLAVSEGWIGRVVDALGRPLDGRGALPSGPSPRPLRAPPPPATARARLGPRIAFGVRALDAFVPSREGQRLGLFAGTGVGKSTLLAMLAGHADCDVTVLALVGERGREVRDFIEDELGEAGLARSVVVVATSDAPPLLRREAAHAAMTVAEHFRDQGRRVLLLMDSLTRYCFALREIALAAGETPGTRGYPPSVFAELPCLLERAGPGPAETGGRITGLFTVLVEGDDMNDPVADAVRGILDGHVVLDRRIAERGRYPAIDVLRSLSRTAPGCAGAEEAELARRARAVLALHAELADLVRLGAYRPGADPAADEALALAPRIEAVLCQARDAPCAIADGTAALRAALAAVQP
ncbi:MAG: FliI/YscN family ATPase [Rhodospirillales bacterium]|nr:FliI/YscN family ATPase [Rhodospirillales bacterium]